MIAGIPLTLPNQITLLRLILALPYFVCLHLHSFTPAIILFVIMGISDIIDGLVARNLGLVTKAGALLDPLVDKVIVIGSLVYFIATIPMSNIIVPWIVLVVILRELLITELRSLGSVHGANMWGKLKTLGQNLCVISLLFLPFYPQIEQAVVALVYVMVALTILSGIIYLLEAGTSRQ